MLVQHESGVQWPRWQAAMHIRAQRCVLVVEKESVFRRLVDDGFTSRLPCVLLTACGFPDYASRAALRRAACVAVASPVAPPNAAAMGLPLSTGVRQSP